MKNLRCLLLLVTFSAGLPPGAIAAASPFRLFEVGVSRFIRDDTGQGRVETGRLNALGAFTRVTSTPSSFVDAVPAELLGKNLIYTEGWWAYGELGGEARANFRLADDGRPVVIRGLVYYRVEPHPEARLDVAGVVNLSTRGRIAAGASSELVGGFVVEGQPGLARRVLIRAIGPSLAQFGVAEVAPDPFVAIAKGRTTFSYNGNWGDRHDADEIAQVAAQLGAFPLARGSKDAVLLLELTPGAYTASVFTEGDTVGGMALLEIYVLP